MSLPQDSGHQLARHGQGCAELLAIMQEQERICKRLLTLSEGERAALGNGRIDDLECATLEKSSLVEQMERLEQKRRGLAEAVAKELGLPSGISLTDLAVRMNSEDASHLLRVRASIVDTVASLREANDQNLYLMRSSLSMVARAIRRVRRIAGSGEVYTHEGRPVQDALGNVLVDCHA